LKNFIGFIVYFIGSLICLYLFCVYAVKVHIQVDMKSIDSSFRYMLVMICAVGMFCGFMIMDSVNSLFRKKEPVNE
jgi:hypothetical protein